MVGALGSVELASASACNCNFLEPRAPFLPVLASHQTYSFNLHVSTLKRLSQPVLGSHQTYSFNLYIGQSNSKTFVGSNL
jgi:hypothetical protein